MKYLIAGRVRATPVAAEYLEDLLSYRKHYTVLVSL